MRLQRKRKSLNKLPKMTDGKTLYKLQGGLMVPTKSEPEIIPRKNPMIISVIKRKTITIYESEYDEWVKIKEEHSWTSLLKTVREGYIFFKQVMANLTVKIESSGNNYSRPAQGIERVQSSHRVQTLNANSPKSLLLQEIKKAMKGDMTIVEFRESQLKRLTEKELDDMQKSEEELTKAWEKTQKKDLCLEDLKAPK